MLINNLSAKQIRHGKVKFQIDPSLNNNVKIFILLLTLIKSILQLI